MNKLLALLGALVLFGCTTIVQPPPVDKTINVQPPASTSPEYELSLPPSITNKNYDLSTVSGLRDYTSAVNWYMYYVFGYTRFLNKMAMAKGWIPPDIDPLCEAGKWTVLGEAPVLTLDDVKKKEDFIPILTEHIRDTNALYNAQKKDYEELERMFRKLCVF